MQNLYYKKVSMANGGGSHLIAVSVVTAAGVIPEFWHGVFVDVLLGGCHFWDEYPLYMERGSRLYVQMGRYPAVHLSSSD